MSNSNDDDWQEGYTDGFAGVKPDDRIHWKSLIGTNYRAGYEFGEKCRQRFESNSDRRLGVNHVSTP